MPNRLMCEVLEELRKVYETRNFSYMPGLIEELQSMGNRMEAKLYDYGETEYIEEEIEKMKNQKKQLRKDILKLKKEKKDLKADD